jgi:hypothetical protein
MSRRALALVAALGLAASCRTMAPPGAEESVTHGPFDWTLGDWRGVRRDGADGSAAPLSVRVEPILAGAGQIESLVVEPNGEVGAYRGFAVQALEPATGRWSRRYVNSTSGRFVPLEGEVDGERSTWTVSAPDRLRESRLVSERVPPDGWRRTMRVSEDGGATWRVLWMDELERAAP